MGRALFRFTPALVAVGLAFAATSVQAQVFDFSITSANGDASGQFITTGGTSPFMVTDVTGTVAGSTITSGSGYGEADNLLYNTGFYVDRAGIAFEATSGIDYNIFLNSPSVGYSLCTSVVEPSCTGGEANAAPVATFTVTTAGVSAAPEPATWALMLLGIGGLGIALRQARRNHGFHAEAFAA